MTEKEFKARVEQSSPTQHMRICGCGPDRQPKYTKVTDSLVVLLCERCGGKTTERKA